MSTQGARARRGVQDYFYWPRKRLFYEARQQSHGDLQNILAHGWEAIRVQPMTQETQMQLEPGAILRSGRETITIVSAHITPAGRPEVSYLADGKLWAFPRRSVERALACMGFVAVGQEDPAVLAERVRLAQANYRARRAA